MKDVLTQVKNDFEYFKHKGLQYLLLNEGNKGLKYLEYATSLSWMLPFIYSYIDEEIELAINNFSIQKFNAIYSGSEYKKVVIYSGQVVDYGALTEQYLKFFIESGYEILFIVPSKENVKFGKETIRLIEASNVNLFISNSRDYIEKIKQIKNKIQEFNPSLAILHFLPNDVVGVSSFTNVYNIERYYVVHNDHTFWLGKICGDIFIEFRNFGVSMSVNRRRIPRDKIRILPFYPIINKKEFQGFPFDRDNKVIGISGANLYKYFVDPKLNYFNTIIELLKENSNFVFCLCGWGEEVVQLIDYIKKNNVGRQFHFLGHRNDFYSLIGNSDILLESYPIKGGLTSLMALEQEVPVIGISENTGYSSSLENLYNLKNYKQPVNFDEFKNETTKLIQSKERRKKLVEVQKLNNFNKKYFTEGLSNILNNNDGHYKIKKILPLRLDDEKMLDYYNNLTFFKNGDYIITKIRRLYKYFSLIERYFALKQLLETKNINKKNMFFSLIRILIPFV